jgi:hypothetical protein
VTPLFNRSSIADSLKRDLAAELARVGTVADPDDTYPVALGKVRSRSGSTTTQIFGRVWNYESLRWEGDAQSALDVLRSLPDNAGPAQLWFAFYPTVPECRLWKELDRVGVSQRLMLQSPDGNRCVGFDYRDDQLLYLTDKVGRPTEFDAGHGRVAILDGTVEQVWSGTFDDALNRIGALPDNVGAAAFWERFPDVEADEA